MSFLKESSYDSSHGSCTILLTQLFTRFFTWFYYDSFMIPECPDMALVLYTNEQIVGMIDGLTGKEWDEVLKLEVLPPLPVDPQQSRQFQQEGQKDTQTEKEKEKEEGEILVYIVL